MLDIAGAAHLFGGETAMIDEIETRLASQGLTARAAIAATPEAAWALARFSPHKIAPATDDSSRLARLMNPLPLAALRLDRKVVSTLAQSGLRRIGDIALRPRAPLTARFGPSLFARLDALMGRTKSPISPLLEAPAYLIERRFADGMTNRDGIEATILALAQNLAAMLERHAEGARRLAVHLFRVDGLVKEIAIGTSRPLADPQAIARLFHERIEALSALEGDEDPLDAGYGFDVLQLAAYAVEPLKRVQNDFEQGLGLADGDREAEALLADLIDRLGARLGAKRIRQLVPNDTHIPERAMVAVPAVELNGSASLGSISRVLRDARLQRAPQHEGELSVPSTSLLMLRSERSERLEARTKLVPAAERYRRTQTSYERELALPIRPIRLFERPEPIDAVAEVPDGPPLRFRWRRVMHEVISFEGPERIAPEWWRAQKQARTRDYFRVEDKQGQRFWLFRAGLYERAERSADSFAQTEPAVNPALPRWYMHGLFA
jgi:protein ImuB